MTSPPGAGPTPAEHPGALAGPPIDWAGLRRVLVVRPDNLGDVLLLSPALRALRAAAPTAALTLLASPGGAGAAALLPELDDVLVHSPSWQLAGAVPTPGRDEELGLVDRIADRGFDAALVFTSFSQSPWPAAYACTLAGVAVRAGLSKEFGGALLTHWVPAPADELHQVDRALHLLARLGVAPSGGDLAVTVPPDAAARAAAARARHGHPRGAPYAVLLPGASCSSRRYPAERFAAVAGLLADTGLGVLVAGPERERPLVEAVAGAAGHPAVLPLVGGLDVPALAALLAGAAVAVTNNSGGMHLADAVRTPLVATFAGTELEEQYAPRSTDAVLLRRETACAPCRAFACPYAHECLDLDPSVVASAALTLLPAHPRGDRVLAAGA